MVAFVTIGGLCAGWWEVQLQRLGINDVTAWWVLSAPPSVLSTQSFKCLGDEYWLARPLCALAFCAWAGFGLSNMDALLVSLLA